MADCRVCGAPLGEPVYESNGPRSVTSMCEFTAGPTKVFFCTSCGHTQTLELPDLARYYDTQYNIFVDSEEEDAIYRVVDGKKVFRVEHQVRTLLDKLQLSSGAHVLDYGCGKSATGRKLLEARPDLAVHLFDVSQAYAPFWAKFLPAERWAFYQPKPEWDGTFDAVLSFFALEHAARPREFIRNLGRLLKREGQLYLLVPNVYENTADLVVVDHVNHFSAPSLRHLLAAAGFADVTIDTKAHDTAFVVSARMTGQPRTLEPDAEAIQSGRRQVEEMSGFWRKLADRIWSFEDAHAGKRAAIYGSGFYGTFIGSSLRDIDGVECFLDQSPFRQAKKLFDKPIIGPEAVSDGIDVVYVGLNPRIARETIGSIGAFRAQQREFFYL